MREYKVVKIKKDGSNLEEKLNEYSKQGWRIVECFSQGNGWLILEKDRILNLDC